MMKLKVGDICKLKKSRPDDGFSAGLYRVEYIGIDEWSGAEYYTFSKVKPDGSTLGKFWGRFGCGLWDWFIEEGKVEIVI